MTPADAKQTEVARIKRALETEPRLMKRQTLFKQLWRLRQPGGDRETATTRAQR